MNKKNIILVMGLSGSGKTTFSKKLIQIIGNDVLYLNADVVRAQHDDWDFSYDGRIRQAQRMHEYTLNTEANTIIIDMICPLIEMRKIIQPHTIFYINRILHSAYPDTDNIFVPPTISECLNTLIIVEADKQPS
jgi:adenylylsulfate kinase